MTLVFNNFLITQRRQRSVLRSVSQRRAGLEQALTSWFARVPVASSTKAVSARCLLMTPATASGGCDGPIQAPPDASSVGGDASQNRGHRRGPVRAEIPAWGESAPRASLVISGNTLGWHS